MKFDIHKCNLELRRLWQEHVTYTRLFIISFFENLPDKNTVLDRLMYNQKEIGDIIGKVYGAQVANTVTRLLKEHISIAGNLLSALKDENKEKAEEENKKWNNNAMVIAQTLNKVNPFWRKDEMYKHLKNHLDLTSGEVTARLAKNYAKELHMFDRAIVQALTMADMLCIGINNHLIHNHQKLQQQQQQQQQYQQQQQQYQQQQQQ